MIEEKYREQAYDWDSEVIELDEYAVAVDIETQGPSTIIIEQIIQDKSASLKKLDMANIVFPFKRIDLALSNTQTFLVELRLSSCNIIS